MFLGGPIGSWSGARRWAGLQRACSDLGLTAVRWGPYSPTLDGGPGAADAVIAAGARAVVCHNDMLAIGVLRRLAERGVRVPEEVSVVGGVCGTLMFYGPKKSGSWPLGISGGNIGYPGYPISASTIYSVLLSETTSYTRIRKLRAIRNVQGDTVITRQQTDAYGNPMYDAYGNPIMITTVINYSGPGDQSLGTTGTGGINFDQTAYAYMSSSYTQSIGVGGSDLYSGGTITAGGLTNFFYDLRSAYISAKENQITVRIDVCHNSCHNSCHGSRGRR